jgi:hypothetical protein
MASVFETTSGVPEVEKQLQRIAGAVAATDPAGATDVGVVTAAVLDTEARRAAWSAGVSPINRSFVRHCRV